MAPAVMTTRYSRIVANDSVTAQNDIITDKKWCQSFPQSLADETSSSKFMTRAMFVAFSCVFRYRKILGDECFKSNYITKSMKIRSLNFENPQSLAISQHLRAAGEAVKDGVLEELAMVITKNKGDVEALEVFSWKMHYDEHNNPSANLVMNGSDNSPIYQLSTINYSGSKSVRDQLVMLVRSLQVICQRILAPLPENYSVNFRLSYMDHTRPDYKVQGFNETKTFYELPEDCQSATLGQLRPGHHGCDLSCSSVFMNDSYEAEMTLKKYTDKLADTLGYDVPNTLYQSFSSDANASNVTQEKTPEPVAQAKKSKVATPDEELIEKVESVQLENSPIKKAVNTRGRRKRGQEEAAAATQQVEEQPPKIDKNKYGRVRSVSVVTPEKRSRRR
ncbi:unnamed protein product [Caenorhabditis angaria]|uniref:HORMA domain-containing protein n=1 Tax=Caenorhabditis angaria TaxID=860376 RepID=A0A9P1I540_9PELO|nr:unnamed protein product [Caenorhabditis angaria]